MNSCSYDTGRGTLIRDELLRSQAPQVQSFLDHLSTEKLSGIMGKAVQWLASYVLTLGASARHHDSGSGGLLDHSLKLAQAAAREAKSWFHSHKLREELVFLASLWALFHDSGKRSNCFLSCSRCSKSLALETLEEFFNFHQVPDNGPLPYKPREGGLHTRASRRLLIAWLDDWMTFFSDDFLKLWRDHMAGPPKAEIVWIESTVQKLNGIAGVQNRLELHRRLVFPLFEKGAPVRFPITPYFYVLVAACLARAESRTLPSGDKNRHLCGVLPDLVMIDIEDADRLVALMKELYAQDHGSLRMRHFDKWKLVEELEREGALFAAGRGRNALVKARVEFRTGYDFSSRFLLLRRFIDGFCILPNAEPFEGRVVFLGARPDGFPERLILGRSNFSRGAMDASQDPQS